MNKRWGSEEILELGPYLVKRLKLNAGKTTSMHFHYAKRETIYVLHGILRVQFDDGRDPWFGRPGEVLTIPEGRANAHAMSSEVGCEYIECSTPQVTDSERLYLMEGDDG